MLEQPGLSKTVGSAYVNKAVRKENNGGMEKKEERSVALLSMPSSNTLASVCLYLQRS